MAKFSLSTLSLLLNLLSGPSQWQIVGHQKKAAELPPTCSRIECPSYEVVDSSDGYEIRRYNSTVWMSTSPIQDISLVDATRAGFLQLFDYIQGKNAAGRKIEMTAPVISEVYPSDGPFCASSFVVSFYVPKVNQPNPPPAKGLQAQFWKPIYVAIRQFGGFVSDSSVGMEAAALKASLSGSAWAAVIEKSHKGRKGDGASVYTVAQYNSPFEFEDRVNEIWMPFDMEGDDLMIM
ncbi:hypothetical protein SAY86_012277 [Trapa natans]|uniref:Heme-binding protein 2 n=1 Tax=Trapa natans TaxID=22666 RepID=A0AAN7RCV8_TRANT|nr:hypothetical protein SAY86_012277 [Trapa natans]